MIPLRVGHRTAMGQAQLGKGNFRVGISHYKFT